MNLLDGGMISGNAKVVRSINRAVILNVIRMKQPISRIQIARLTGLNKSTVSSIVSDLLLEDLLYEQASEDQNIGRSPINLSLKLGVHLVGAINIDSSVTRFAIADIDGRVLGSTSINTDSKNGEQFIKTCLKELEELCHSLKIFNLEGLGFSIAGIVDSKNSVVTYAPNLGWEEFNIGEVVKREWPEIRIVTVDNDAKASALAELWFGNHDLNLSNFVFLSIGPGIGSGIVIENKILDGEFHATGEFGHMTIFEEGKICRCGNYGCWEAYASDAATVKRFNDKKQNSSPQSVDLMVQDIINMAKNNDETAIEVLTQTGYYLGLGIAHIIRAIDPHTIVLGGRIVQVWDIIYPQIEDVIRKRAFFGRRKNIRILPTSLEVRPRLLGAATLVIKEIFDDYKIMV